jgi:hypothetical protein
MMYVCALLVALRCYFSLIGRVFDRDPWGRAVRVNHAAAMIVAKTVYGVKTGAIE